MFPDVKKLFDRHEKEQRKIEEIKSKEKGKKLKRGV